MTIPEWQARATAKKKSQQDALPKEYLIPEVPSSRLNVTRVPVECGLLTPEEIAITETKDVALLLSRLRSGELSSYACTLAFIKRAVIAQQVVNCLTEFFFDDALATAKSLDALQKTGKLAGPLHGLPISLKDQFHIKGKELNMGFASWVGQISEEDAALVKCLRKAGAVLYTRTNVPVTLMFGETDNYVYGRTVNPHNRSLTCGGSSGGCGALVGMGGSPLSVGTDIGGSVRIPSVYNGLYGLRPTMRRLPYGDASNTYMGIEAIESSLGPITRSLSGCVEFVRGVLSSHPADFDPKCVEIDWREDMYQLKHIGGKSAKLSFGYYESDGTVRPTPPVLRALRHTVAALRKAGHEVIEWKPLNHAEAIEVLYAIFLSDGGTDFKETLKESGEPLHPQVSFNGIDSKHLNVYESWQLNRKKDAHRKANLYQWMATASHTSTGRPIDGLISCALPYPAPKHTESSYYAFTGIYNLLDWPSVVLPVTAVQESDTVEADFKPANQHEKTIYDRYNPKEYVDAPVGVQVAGRRFREEELLGVCEVVDRVLQSA